MPTHDTAAWSQTLQRLRNLSTTTYAAYIETFPPPNPGTFATVNHRRFLITQSRRIDGVILGVAPQRSSCLVAVELPGDSVIAIVSDAPAVLDTVLVNIMEQLGPDFTFAGD